MKRIFITLALFIMCCTPVLADSEKVWTREYLNEHGIGNDRISYIRGTIFIDGIEFYKVTSIEGKSYATKSEFSKAVAEFLEGSLVVTIESKDGTIRKKSGISSVRDGVTNVESEQLTVK